MHQHNISCVGALHFDPWCTLNLLSGQHNSHHHFPGLSLYWCYNPHRLRDSMSPVCGIIFEDLLPAPFHRSDRFLTQFWRNYNTALTQFWHSFDIIMTQFWNRSDTVMRQFWHNSDTILTQLWYSFDTVLTQFLQNSETDLKQVWHNLDKIMTQLGKPSKKKTD